MKNHEALWFGVVAWGIVLLGTFVGLAAWWDSSSRLFGSYAWWSLLTALIIGGSVWAGVHYYQRHRWLIVLSMITPYLLGLVALMLTINSKTYNATPLVVIPLVYSIPSAVVAWIIAIIGAERLRRKHSIVAGPTI